MTLSKALDCFWSEERLAMEALNSAPVRRSVMALVRSVEAAFRNGGRLIYVGAGTSGRLGVLDASECPPTFRTPPEWVQGIMAGGVTALHSAVEGAEDDTAAGARAVDGRKVSSRDVVVGIAASGRTPFVWGALDAARKAGAKTGLITLNPRLSFRGGWKPDHVIAVETGPEVITGSTRLKAGTATKLILNAVTSLSMVRLGKVMDNLMVDLNPSNAKLRDRAARMVMELTGVAYAEAVEALMPGTKNGAGTVPMGALRTIREAVRSLRRSQVGR
jgi:N-acetylmuramic acid 6-phosphate etherase